MPIDFRTYTDPGVYIESITPPVVFTAAIEPTILAIVGSAPSARDIFESTNLVSGSWITAVNYGGDPSTLKTKDRVLGTQYVSAAVGDLDIAITNAATSIDVTTYDGIDLPLADRKTQLVVLSGYDGTDAFKFTYNAVETGTVTRGTNHTAAGIKTVLQAHADIQTVNVVGTTDASTFAVQFVDPVAEGGLLTITSGTGGTTGVITQVFLAQIEDEIIGVSTGTEGTGQTWTVVRGVGSTAAAHGIGQVVNAYETYSLYPSVEVAELAAPVSSTSESFSVNELYGVQTVTLTGYSGTDSFKFTYNGVETAVVTRGTNYTLLGIKAALEGHADITLVEVTSLLDDYTLLDSGFTVRFLDPNTDVTALTLTSLSGVTAVVANRGVATDTYLDVEGERMLVTSVSGSAPQTVAVTRGVNGTFAAGHGAVTIYENTGADYLVEIGSGTDGTFLTEDDTLSLLILDGTRISSGSYVNLAFEATDAAQFSAGLFDDLDTIRDKYGDPLDSTGSISSELTLGAQLALANGATQLVLVAVNPADITVSDTAGFQAAIAKLAFELSVNSIAILSGIAADINYLKGHVQQQSENGNLCRGFVGLDGLGTPTPDYSSFITKAGQMNSERVSLVAPGQFKLDNGTTTPTIVPGYFAAAAVAGVQAGLPPQEPLTRKQVFGFVGINNQDTTQNIFSMQAAGVLVVFEDRLSRLIIKHGLTTDMSTVYSREISVITSRDRLRDFILDTLEGGALIGSPMTSDTPNLVMAAVNAALEESVRQGLIFDYSDVKFRYPTENPTMIEIRFSYKPTLPLNYIHVQFSIDTNTGTVEFQNINDSTAQ